MGGWVGNMGGGGSHPQAPLWLEDKTGMLFLFIHIYPHFATSDSIHWSAG